MRARHLTHPNEHLPSLFASDHGVEQITGTVLLITFLRKYLVVNKYVCTFASYY